MYGDGDICDWDGDGCDRDGVGMGRNLWGWGGYGENKLSVVPVQQSSVNTYGCVFVCFFVFFL